MSGRLAIDFGTTNTVIALWDITSSRARILKVADWSRQVRCTPQSSGDEPMWVVPSLIHYNRTGDRWLGEQVVEKRLRDSPGTFRWLKHYIRMRSPVRLSVDGSPVEYRIAGEDFLSSIISRVLEQYRVRVDEVAFTMPVDAFEQYEEWIATVAARAGITRFRLIDEASAAALGYNLHPEPDVPVMVVDFGGGTLDVAIVLLEETPDRVHRSCRVLGKAGEDIGGISIDQWVFREVLKRWELNPGDSVVQRMGYSLLASCEKAKEQLSVVDVAEIEANDPVSGRTFRLTIKRNEFDALLEDHECFSRIHTVIQKALNEAMVKGYPEDKIGKVLMVGGSSSIPAIQTVVRKRFGDERVLFDHACDAVACGAASFVAEANFSDHIQHDYAIRYWNSKAGQYDFQILVRRGTPSPSRVRVAHFFIKATYDGQTQMGIPIYEMGDDIYRKKEHELVPDSQGGLRLIELNSDDSFKRAHFWMNEHNPTFLRTHPPVKKGESRFEVWFDIDGNKRLLVTSRDLMTGRMIMERQPVVQLA